MKSKNPRHNSVRIVRRDYYYSGTCQCQCSALEDITSVYQCKNYILFFKNMFFVKKKKRRQKQEQNKKTMRPLKKLFLFSTLCFGGLWKPDMLLLTTDKMQLQCWFPVSWWFHNYFKFFSSLWSFDTSVEFWYECRNEYLGFVLNWIFNGITFRPD